MAINQIEPYYRTGTATFNTTDTVTGQGTSWLGQVEPGDQIFNRIGQMAIILSVVSNTSIKLVAPFAGTVQAAQAYAIYRVPDSVRLENFSQRMVDLLKGGNLPSLGGLPLAADKLLYANGPGSFALADFTSAARELLDDTSHAAMVSTLGLLAVQSSAMDTTANRLLRSGAFGLGPGFVDVSNMAAAETSMTRFFRVTGSALNGPGFQAAVIAATFNATTTCYLAIGVDGRCSVGVKTGDTGVPVWTALGGTSGSNANGYWTRDADGTQTCYITNLAMTRNSNTTVQGTWTFPMAFANSNIQIDFLESTLPVASGRESAPWATSTTTAGTLRLVQNGIWPDPTNTTVQAKAIGRWK